ncbi:MAG: glycosyltransferase [Crocinitomicaceae bacterium]
MSKSAKKIIIISPAFPYRGGIAATSDRLAKAYLDRGEDVEIWTYKLLYPKVLFPGKSQYLDLDQHKAPEGIKILRKISTINPFNWLKVGRQLKKVQPDLVIVRYWLPFLGPALGSILRFGKSKSSRFIGLIDNVIPHEKRFGDDALSNYFYKRLDGFLVMAKKGVIDLKERFNITKNVSYSPHPLYDIYGKQVSKEEAISKLNLDPNNKYILSFGLIRKYKGLDWLLTAFAEFAKEHPNYRLIIAGECYDEWADYQKIIDDKNIGDRIIRFDEFIPDKEVKYYFSAADFLTLTYRTATQSGVTQIAYSMHLPIFVTNVGDLAEMVPNDKVGLVVEPVISSIVNGLSKMAVEEELKKYRMGVINEKKRFEWDTLCDNLDALMNS